MWLLVYRWQEQFTIELDEPRTEGINMDLLKDTFPELDYILDVIFCSSLQTERPVAEISAQSLRLSYDNKRGIVIKQPLIIHEARNVQGILCMTPLPDEYVPVIDERMIPIFRNEKILFDKHLIYDDGESIIFNFDILYSAFYILTRMEEMERTDLDKWGRFPASASHAYKNNYLHRPVVDEYAEILWFCIKKLWPGLQRKERKFEMMLTHDVDEPFEALFKPAWRMVRSFGSDIMRKHNARLAVDRAKTWFEVKQGQLERDRVYNFNRIMDIDESVGCKGAFYFIPDCSSKMSGDYRLDHPAIKGLIRHICERGHEIGYHGSFDTYMDMNKTKQEVAHLKEIATLEGASQIRWGGRQHYLRWSAPQTWRNYAEAGLDYDATLSYANVAGFRCGTCRPYTVFDAKKRKVLGIIEYPLIVMECSLLDESYMGYSYEEAREYIIELKHKCFRYKGSFVTLWHNSRFITKNDWSLYQTVLDK